MDKTTQLLEAASLLLQAAPKNRLNAVTLNKALFYLDLVALRDKGHTVTHNSYIALRHGPVVAKYDKRLIRELEKHGIAKQLEEWDGSKPIVHLDPSRKSSMDGDTVLMAFKIGRVFSGMSSTRASEFSHENPGWEIAWAEGMETGRPMPIDLRIAMQQIIQDDAWLEEPLADEEKEELEAADLGDGDEW